MLDAELARTVRRAELAQASEHDGLKSMKSWLRTHARQSASAVIGLVKAGRVQDTLPAMAAACAAGLVTADQVEVLAEIAPAPDLPDHVRTQLHHAAAELTTRAEDCQRMTQAGRFPHAGTVRPVSFRVAAATGDQPPNTSSGSAVTIDGTNTMISRPISMTATKGIVSLTRAVKGTLPIFVST